MAAQAFDLNPWEAEAGIALGVQGQPGMHRETLSQKIGSYWQHLLFLNVIKNRKTSSLKFTATEKIN